MIAARLGASGVRGRFIVGDISFMSNGGFHGNVKSQLRLHGVSSAVYTTEGGSIVRDRGFCDGGGRC